MNQNSLRQWRFQIGLVQAVILVGMICGSMVCVFYLGFLSGQRVGYQTALETSISTAPKVPIALNREEESDNDELLSEVSAKLRHRDELPEVPEESKPAGGGALPVDEGDALERLAAQEDRNQHVSPDVAAVNKEPGLGLDSVYPSDDRVAKKGAAPSVDESAAVEDRPPAKTTLGLLLSSNEKAAKDEPKDNAEPPAGIKAPPPTPELIEKSEIKIKEPAKIVTPPAQPKKEPTLSPKKEAVAVASTEIKKQPSAAVSSEAQSSFIKAVIPKGWFAQVAAPVKVQEANALAAKLKGSGFPVVIEAANVRGQQYFRILVGPEKNTAQAEILLQQLKREPYIAGTPFLRRVK